MKYVIWVWSICFILLSAPGKLEAEQLAGAKDTIPDIVNHLVDRYYEAVSGDKDRNWSDLRALCVPKMSIHVMGIDSMGKSIYWAADLDAYIEHLEEYREKQAFYQNELERTLDHYADMAQVWSVYESRNEPGGPLIDQGILGFHLMKTDRGWRIVHLMWNSETDKHPLNGH